MTDASLVSGVPPFAVRLGVVHVHDHTPAAGRAARRHVEHERSGGWDVHLLAVASVRDVMRLRRDVSRLIPHVVVLHGRRAGALGRLALRGAWTTVLVPGPQTGRLLPVPLRFPSAVWSWRTAGWANVVVHDGPSSAAEGVRLNRWLPPFVVRDEALDRFSAVVSRAHVFGGAGADRRRMPGRRPRMLTTTEERGLPG